MPKFIIPIGIPGSGKTRYFKIINNPQIILLSGDEERGSIGGCVRHIMIKKAEMLVKSGISVYFDSPNITRLGRIEVIEKVKEANPNYEIIGVYFNKPLEVCLNNNKLRGNTVPEDRIIDMAGHFEKPSIDEGFSKIIIK